MGYEIKCPGCGQIWELTTRVNSFRCEDCGNTCSVAFPVANAVKKKPANGKKKGSVSQKKSKINFQHICIAILFCVILVAVVAKNVDEDLTVGQNIGSNNESSDWILTTDQQRYLELKGYISPRIVRGEKLLSKADARFIQKLTALRKQEVTFYEAVNRASGNNAHE